MLTNDIVSFEQLGPECHLLKLWLALLALKHLLGTHKHSHILPHSQAQVLLCLKQSHTNNKMTMNSFRHDKETSAKTKIQIDLNIYSSK